MAIVYQYDKRHDVTYAYNSESYYDKEKKQSRSRRTLIGRVNPETKQIEPTRKTKRSKSYQDGSSSTGESINTQAIEDISILQAQVQDLKNRLELSERKLESERKKRESLVSQMRQILDKQM